jgi:PPOX class probable F420-dependent enzyme
MASPLKMTRSEREQFLADVHIGVLAVEAPDGPPSVAPLWYEYEPGGDVLFTTDTDTIKHEILRTTGRASLCVQREGFTPAYVTVEGSVTIGETSVEQRTRIASRYLGDEMAKAYIESTRDTPTVQMRLTPQRWRTTDYAKLSGAAEA